MTWKRLGRLAGWGVSLLLGVAVAAYLLSREVRYVTRAGLEEARILWRARSIASAVADPDLPAEVRGWLTLVQEVRDAAPMLGLSAGKTYTSFADVGRDTLLLVLSAAPKDCICPVTWWYPVVGAVPYKGFFSARDARAEEQRLAARGLDTSLRPAAAFSTLGWFQDPLLSTALVRDSVELAALVLHEMAHNTLYVPSATAFNESFAEYVGYRAAEEFFRARGDSGLAARARARGSDEQVLGEFYDALVTRLQAFYATRPTPAALDSGRTAMGRWARDQLVGPVGARLSFAVGPLADRPINNAALIGVQLYRTHLDWFTAWDHQHRRDLPAGIRALNALQRGAVGDSAFARLSRAVGNSRLTPAP